MRNLDKILTETEKLQQELHNFVDDMRKEERGKNLSYDALQTIFILFKITELRDDVIDINSKLW